MSVKFNHQSSACFAARRAIGHRQNSQQAFTLIELLVTISIVAVLASIGLVVFSSVQKTARISKRLQDLKALQTAIEVFKSTKGFYPSATTKDTFGCVGTVLTGANVLTPIFLQTIPNDPASSSYCYEYASNGDISAGTAATEYKIKTYHLLPTTEMAVTEYDSQHNLLDPAKDSSPTNCTIDSATATNGWAYYTPGYCIQ